MLVTSARATTPAWRSPRLLPWLLVAAGAACLLAFWAPSASANHAQEGVTFDSLGGNEWWVDLQLGGSYAFYGPPQVRDTDRTWDYMEQPSWAGPGRYVKSYHVEPGHDVKFRVTYKGSVVLSCWFKHPTGVEACDGSETFAATFAPSFTSSRSSVDVISTRITANQPVNGASWMVAGSYWGNTLDRQADGSWKATEARAPDGVILQFLTWSDDDYSAYVESDCYQWPSGAAVACPPRPSAHAYYPRSLDGDPSHLTVNAYTDSSAAPQKVEVRFDGGDFEAMQGPQRPNEYEWTFSYDQAPSSGHHVAQFRITDEVGRSNCDQDGWNWPQDTGFSQYGEGNEVWFEEMKGSTSWVQTNAYSWTPIVAVGVLLPDGSERMLTKQAWCDWAAQVDLAAGTQVRFIGYFPNFDHDISAAMAWPPGSSPPPPPPPPPPGFTAQFTLVTGNEWWVQTQVTPSGGTLSKVDVRLNGGDWKPLKLQPWGVRAYAASYHIPEGTVVQFHAVSTTGQEALSACYHWLPPTQNGENAHEVACTSPPPPPPPPPPGTFKATFSNVRGNEWWVETDVKVEGGTLSKVDVRLNGGSWTSMAKQSWGSWAKSIHAVPGTTVEFRATSTAGDTSMSGAYTWKDPYP